MNHKEKKRLMKLRKKLKKNSPKFRRVESWRHKKVKDSWRKPRGLDNKSRQHKKSGIKSPNIGYRSPKKVRGLHPSGLKDILVMHKSDLENLNPNVHGVRVSSKLGGRKKINLIEYAIDEGFRVFNLGLEMQTGFEEEFADLDEEGEYLDEEFEDIDEIEDLEDEDEEI